MLESHATKGNSTRIIIRLWNNHGIDAVQCKVVPLSFGTNNQSKGGQISELKIQKNKIKQTNYTFFFHF